MCVHCLLPVQTFWDHEWNRHGTCAAPVTGGQHRFFGTVLGLHHKLNIQVGLTAASLVGSMHPVVLLPLRPVGDLLLRSAPEV